MTLNNSEAKNDIHWWCDFLPTWNRASIIPDPMTILSTDIKLFTDASKTHGFGAVMGTSWLQSPWPSEFQHENIDFMELFAILVATCTWGSGWSGRRVVFVTDNKPITQVWCKGTSPSVKVMGLIRKLFLFAASHDFSISLKHVFGHYNPVADALSRFQDRRFRQLMPEADTSGTPIPPSVWRIGNHLETSTTSCS